MAIDREQDQVLQTSSEEQQNGTHESLPPADSQDVAQEAQGGVARQEYERVSQERDALLDRLARLQAEFENYRRRVDRERAETYARSRAEVVLELLPVIDNFERALASLEHSGNDAKSLHEGIELIHRQLNDALRHQICSRVIPIN